MKPRVRLADPAADRPRAGVLWGTGLGALAAGLALSAALAAAPQRRPQPMPDAGIEPATDAPTTLAARTTRTAPTRKKKRKAKSARGHASQAAPKAPVEDAALRDAATPLADAGGALQHDAAIAPDASVSPPDAAATAPTDAAIALAPSVDAGTAAAGERSGANAPLAAAAAPEPVAEPPGIGPGADVRAREAAARAAAKRIEPGIVAYVRCEGLPRKPGRFPCPREPELERAVWDTLARLARCDESPGRGDGEVRLDFIRNRRAQVQIRARGKGAPRLDAGAVQRCVGERLQALRSKLSPRRMIVSFRFRVR